MASFKEAFKAARKAQGAGGTFTWNGKLYTTDYKEEVGKKPKKKSFAPKSSPRPVSRNTAQPTAYSTAPTMATPAYGGGPAPKKRTYSK